MRGSAVYAHLWSTPEVEALLADEGRLAAWLDILAALARAQGELGLIPAEAADEIARSAVLENLDLAYVVEQTRATEHSTLGLIRGVQQVLSAEAGEWFCYGATVQDVADTWCALVMRDAGRFFERDLAAVEAALRGLGRPEGPWISARDRLAEFGAVLAMVCATLGKLGNEVLELARPEIGELAEPFTPGAVGSITMPHKRNPERSEQLVTLARLARA